MTVLIEQFQLGVDAARQLALFEPRYNIAPTQEILAVRVEPKQRRARGGDVAVGAGAVVEQGAASRAADDQRPRRDDRGEAELSHRGAAAAVPDSGRRVL